MAEQLSYTCPHCGATSYNSNDLREGYCGACHQWRTDPLMLADAILAEMSRLDELARIRSAIAILTAKERELTEAHEHGAARIFME